MGSKKDECECCVPCDLCENNRVPVYLLLLMADWIDFVCAAANAACPSAPNPISPSSLLNATIQLDLAPALSNAGESGCNAWYEGSIAYGDFLRDDTGGPTIGDCNVMFGGSIRFAVNVASIGGGDKSLQFFSYTGEGNYVAISGLITGASPWFCSAGESDPLDMDGYTAIRAGTSDAIADHAGIFTTFAACSGSLPPKPTVTLEASAETTRLAA